VEANSLLTPCSAVATPVTPATPLAIPTPIATPTPTESTKNDQVLFKNFFGATKNAIFRTAQSIIENHEKKNAAKQKEQPDHSAALALVSSPSGAEVLASFWKSSCNCNRLAIGSAQKSDENCAIDNT